MQVSLHELSSGYMTKYQNASASDIIVMQLPRICTCRFAFVGCLPHADPGILYSSPQSSPPLFKAYDHCYRNDNDLQEDNIMWNYSQQGFHLC